MPSSRSPLTAISLTTGRLPSGSVPGSALTDATDLLTGAALESHIGDPLDAHMATAIGINGSDTVTGQEILTSLGGVVDGESVFDLITAYQDILPVRANSIGFAGAPNSGVPTWSGTTVEGGFSSGSNLRATHYIYNAGQVATQLFGMIYPADRGVLALYSSTDGDYFDSGTTSLIAALWLGSSTMPSGMVDANYNESLRRSTQANHNATLVGLDIMSLANRLPQLADYSPYSNPFSDYDRDAFRHQLANYGGTGVAFALSAGPNNSWLVVHWRETYATTLTAISPANLNVGTYVQSNLYSKFLVDFDSGFPATDIGTARRYPFKDSNTGSPPTYALFSIALVVIPSTVSLSGLSHYIGILTWAVTVRVDELFKNSYLLGPDNPPLVPAGFGTDYPMTIHLNEFGSTDVDLAYHDLQPTFGSPYTEISAPQTTDQAEYDDPTLAMPTTSSYTEPGQGWSQVSVTVRRPHVSPVSSTHANKYLYNNAPQTGGSTISTATLEHFIDEKYRYRQATLPTPTKPLIPAGGDDYDSTTLLSGLGYTNEAQCVGSGLTYPNVDYSTGFIPAGADYAAVFAGDPALNDRNYLRAFDTGQPLNRGRFRLRLVGGGPVFPHFASTGAFTGVLATDHPGGLVITVNSPTYTTELDLGRAKNSPDDNVAVAFRGVLTKLTVDGDDTYVDYDTTFPTEDNGSGAFLLFVRIYLIKGVFTGALDLIEWLPPE